MPCQECGAGDVPLGEDPGYRGDNLVLFCRVLNYYGLCFLLFYLCWPASAWLRRPMWRSHGVRCGGKVFFFYSIAPPEGKRDSTPTWQVEDEGGLAATEAGEPHVSGLAIVAFECRVVWHLVGLQKEREWGRDGCRERQRPSVRPIFVITSVFYHPKPKPSHLPWPRCEVTCARTCSTCMTGLSTMALADSACLSSLGRRCLFLVPLCAVGYPCRSFGSAPALPFWWQAGSAGGVGGGSGVFLFEH